MTLRIRVAAQPAVMRSGAYTRYTATRERTVPTFSQGVSLDDNANSEAFDLGPEVFEFEEDEQTTVENELMDGNVRQAVVGPARRVLSINLSRCNPANLATLDRMLRSGRPLAVGAWYDHTTQLMSHCAGQDSITGGVAEVGWSMPGCVHRREGSNTNGEEDHWDHPVAGPSWLMHGLWNGSWYQPKITAGMIGRAFRFDRGAVANLATPRKTTTNVGSAALQIFPPANFGGSVVNVVIGTEDAQPFFPGALGTFTTHIWMTSSATWLNYVFTNDQTVAAGSDYMMSLLVRGSGTITMAWVESSTVIAQTVHILTGEWQWITCAVTPTATTGTVRIYAGAKNSSASACMVEVQLMQIEKLLSRTAFMDYGTNPTVDSTDALVFNENLNPPFTFACYFKYVADDDQKPLLFYKWTSSAGDTFMALMVRGADVILECPSGTNLVWTDAMIDLYQGDWASIHMTLKAATDSNIMFSAEIFVNGVSAGANNNSSLTKPMADYNPTDSGAIHIGGDLGQNFGTPVAANTAIDCFRIDRRIWTAAEIADDYELRTDPGMQLFLARVQGRYFRPMASFRPQAVYTDLMVGRLRLRQVAYNPASAT